MRVRPDDADSDWTLAGVYEVSEGVYRIPLPMPQDGLRAVNAYALTADDDLVLIDSGWGIVEARESLDAALNALGRRLADVRQFLVTHVHRDHYGLAVALRREFGSKVSLGEGEREAIRLLSDPGHDPVAANWQRLIRWGAKELADRMASMRERPRHNRAEYDKPDEWIFDGAVLDLPSRTLRAIATPGHTRGHVVFLDRDAGLLFSGDHVLPHITPSIGFEAAPPELPLANYLDSLRLVRSLPDQRLLPAHGPVRPSVHARVDELLRHHEQRLDLIAGLVRDELTAYEVARQMTWTRRERRFDDLDLLNQTLAVGEAAAHLNLLVAQGRLKCVDVDGVRRYRSV